MNVKQLRAALYNVPDDMELTVLIPDGSDATMFVEITGVHIDPPDDEYAMVWFDTRKPT